MAGVGSKAPRRVVVRVAAWFAGVAAALARMADKVDTSCMGSCTTNISDL